MSLAILGMGTAVPDGILLQTDALEVARALCHPTDAQETWLPSMYHGTGITARQLALGADVIRDVLDGTNHSGSPFVPRGVPGERGPTTGQRMRLYAELAPPLALEAARGALDRSSLAARELSHLITVSCTGFVAPGIDLALIRGLGLAPTVQRTHVGYMGCHGALNGLRVARAFAAEPEARILLCAVELCSLHYHYDWNPSKMIANAIFGDGAAALVGAPSASSGEWRVTAAGSCLVPDSADAMTWTVCDHGFEMTLSKRVPGLIATHLRPWLEQWLTGHGLSLAEVGSWAIHPGGPRILDAVEDALSLPATATATARAVFADHGNMSSPTVLFIVDRLRAEGAARPCVALGFGPGLMAEVVLFQ
jgi:predicted naringenin-chalcone synthase